MANATASPTTILDIQYWYDTNYVGIAGFTIMLWDHVDTFVAEVELIWLREKSLLTYLFLLNRYLIPLGFVVNLYAYLHKWSEESCTHFIRYEGSMTMIGVTIAEIIMLLRVRALYYSQKWIYYGVGLLLVTQTIINAWLLTKGAPVHHWENPEDPIRACTMIFDEKGSIANASAWFPLLYDTVVFVLTTIRVLPGTRLHAVSMSEINKRLFEGGIMYYCTIFAVAFALTIMIPTAPPGIRNIGGQLHLLITVTMVSRITLSLKQIGTSTAVNHSAYADVNSGPIRFVKGKTRDLEGARDGNRGPRGYVPPRRNL